MLLPDPFVYIRKCFEFSLVFRFYIRRTHLPPHCILTIGISRLTLPKVNITSQMEMFFLESLVLLHVRNKPCYSPAFCLEFASTCFYCSSHLNLLLSAPWLCLLPCYHNLLYYLYSVGLVLCVSFGTIRLNYRDFNLTIYPKRGKTDRSNENFRRNLLLWERRKYKQFIYMRRWK